MRQFLALRDISHFVLGVSIQDASNGEARDPRLPSASAQSRDAALSALDNIRVPDNVSREDLASALIAVFRIILPDPLNSSQKGQVEAWMDEHDLDALDNLSRRLRGRQAIHRLSDRDMTHRISQVLGYIAHQNGQASSHFGAAYPAQYVVNCPDCHFNGGAYLQPLDTNLVRNSVVSP